MEHPSEVVVTQPNTINPLLQRVRIPGETFPLPSGGLFYTNGELSPDVKDGEVHVYPMTAVDELVMKSVDKVFSGEAVKEVFGRCVPSVLKPGELSAKDIDYLLVAIRKVSYGPTFDVTYTHDCEGAKEHDYNVSLDTFLQGTKKVNPVTMREAFKFTLPNGQVIQFKPSSYNDVVAMYQSQHADYVRGTDNMTDAETLDRILTGAAILIGSVDGNTNRVQIIEWLRSLPILWLRDISLAAQDTTSWGITFEVTITCKDCKETLTVPTPLNPISFFI